MATINDVNDKIKKLNNYLKDIDNNFDDFIKDYAITKDDFYSYFDSKYKDIGKKIDVLGQGITNSITTQNRQSNSNNSSKDILDVIKGNSSGNILDVLDEIKYATSHISAHITQAAAPNHQQQPQAPTSPVAQSPVIDKINSGITEIISYLQKISGQLPSISVGHLQNDDGTTLTTAKAIGERRAEIEFIYRKALKDFQDKDKDNKKAEWNQKTTKEKLKARWEGDDDVPEKNTKGLKSQLTKMAFDTASAVMKGNIDSSQVIDKITGMLPGIWGGIAQIIKAGFDIYGQQSKLGSQYARTIGGGQFGQREFINRDSEFVRRQSKLMNNYSFGEVASAITSVAESMGRSAIRMTDSNLKSAIDLKRMGVESDTLNMFDTFGRSFEETDKYFAKLYSSASKKGLSFSNVSKAVKDNLKLAQSYTFSKGLNGLAKMAETSVQLKYNMNEVAKIAEKVSTVEGALQTSAGLSVLGGDFANFSNPMSLLYEGLNDMEALNERMVDMFSGMAHFDAEKGQIDISAFNKQRMRAASEAMGVSYDEMLTLAMNKERGNIVERQLTKNGSIDAETAEYIKNLAQIDEKGNAYITDEAGKRRDVSSLNIHDKEFLKKESERKGLAENAKMGDVYNSTRDMYDKLDQIMNYLSTKLGVWVAKIAGVGTVKPMEGVTRADRRRFARGVGKWDTEEFDSMRKRYDTRKERRIAMRRGEFDAAIANVNNPSDTQGYPNGIIPGESHFNGGVAANFKNKPVEIEGGEALINKLSVSKYGKEFFRAVNNGTYNPYSKITNAEGNIFKPMKFGTEHPTQGSSVQKITFEPLKIDLGGNLNLKLEGNNIGKIDAKSLITPQFIDLLTKEINKRIERGGFNKEKFHTSMSIV